jgi:hypothetical protein
MKYLAMIILLGLSTPGCSRFTKNGRMDRAYYKQMKQVKAAREKRRKNLIQHQRAEMPSLRNNPPPPLLEQQTVQPTPENQ